MSNLLINSVEALLFAASDPLDEKTLREMLPVDTDIEQIMNNLLNLYKIHISIKYGKISTKHQINIWRL